ncbi:hypothetical protein EI94DRAFT_1831192 [Lactarius quietus]|nr:hypothetical protein EI94DRAFT_1831192 [Lactarius quietus]
MTQGAVLSLPIGAERENTAVREGFGKWMIKHIDQWFAWITDIELGIEQMEDIANVAFLGGQANARVSFGVEFEPTGSRINWDFSLERNTGAAWNWGPSGENLPVNQCVFIRGFRVHKRMLWRPKLRAAAKPNPDPKGDDGEPDAELIPVPAVPQYRDPLHVILEYISEVRAERPKCDMAIVHDDDLAQLNLLGDGVPPETLRPDVVLSCLRGSKLVIHEVVLGPELSSGSSSANVDAEIVRVASLEATFEGQPDSESGRMIATRVLKPSLKSKFPLNPSKLPRLPRFNEDPVTDVRSLSPASSVSSLPPSPISVYAPSSRKHNFPSPRFPVYPQAPLTSRVCHTVLAAPSLQYDMRHHPNRSNLRLSPAVLAEPASNPSLASLRIRVADLPWLCTVRPDLKLSSPGNAVVTVQDVLVCLYFHLRTAVKADEYNGMSKARKAEIYQMFERRVGDDHTQRGKGLRRIDFLGGFIAQGLTPAQSKDEDWDIVVR